jgi:hypothetical protein
MPSDDRDLAAILFLALRSRALSFSGVIARLDAEIASRADVPAWMCDVSLAGNLDTLSKRLDRASFAHPALVDPPTAIEVLSIALDAGVVTPEDFAKGVCRFLPENLPAATHTALAGLDELVRDGHERDGVPRPRALERAAESVSKTSRGISRFAPLIGSLRPYSASQGRHTQ